MGGRGGSSGMTSNRGYTKDGTIKQNGEKMFAERMTGGNIYGSQAVVLEATTDGNGNLTLEYAQQTFSLHFVLLFRLLYILC